MSEAGSDIDLTDPQSFRHWVEENVRIADTDAGGHINNTAIAAYVESGRVARLQAAMSRRNAEERWVIAHVAIDFRAEGSHPGTVRIGTRLLRLGGKSATFGAGLFLDGRSIATAQSVMVFLRGPQTTAIPEAVRRRFLADDGG